MELTTKYLGLRLAHPFVAGASPASDTVERCVRLERGGAAAIVLRSLFEEQIVGESHLLGQWQAELGGQSVALRLGPHPELRDSVRGTLQRSGRTVQVVGDVDDGQLTRLPAKSGRLL